MLRSLTAQLLEHWPREFAMSTDAFSLANEGFEALWQVFVAGVLSLSSGATIFCIIDGSARYRDEDELAATVSQLIALCKWLAGTGSATRMKLLLATPTTPEVIMMFDEDRDQVIMSTEMHDRPELNDGRGQHAILTREFVRARWARSPMAFGGGGRREVGVESAASASDGNSWDVSD